MPLPPKHGSAATQFKMVDKFVAGIDKTSKRIIKVQLMECDAQGPQWV